MNSASLRTFLAIVETGSLVKAADQLNVTQSTVTARLQSLEQELGQQLFHRRRSGAELTSAGFKFRRYAQLMTDLWRQAQMETSLPPAVTSVCNLGCESDLWPGLGSAYVEWLKTNHASTSLSAWPGDQQLLNRWLGSGLIDAAVSYSPLASEQCSVEQLGQEELLLVSTKPRELVRWDPGYVYVDAGEDYRQQHAAAYPDSDSPTMTFGSAVWALDYLMKVGGSAHLPARLIKKELKEGKLHLVPDAPLFRRKIYLVYNSKAAGKWPWLADLLKLNSILSETSRVRQ